MVVKAPPSCVSSDRELVGGGSGEGGGQKASSHVLSKRWWCQWRVVGNTSISRSSEEGMAAVETTAPLFRASERGGGR
jgi:hypothetical protein